MKLLELLKGKKIMVNTDLNVVVEMEIDRVEEKDHSEELEPSTRENDWWPKTRDWTTYVVHFTNGSRKEYSSLNEINVH